MTCPRVTLSPGLGQSLTLSRLVWGAWRIADGVGLTAREVARLIDACLDQGITSFDHADIYGDYRCESLFGEALAHSRAAQHHLQVVTKTDIMLKSASWPATRVKHYDTSSAHVEASVDRSLQRLGVSVIDVLLIHRPDPLMDPWALGECLDNLIQKGKIRAAGVSNFMPWDLDALQRAMRHRLVTNQIELSPLASDGFRNGQVVHAQSLRMPLMAWSPLAGGRLVQDDAAHRALKLALEGLAKQHQVELQAVALAWLLHHPANILPVCGSTQLSRVATLAQALDVPMDRQTWFELYALGLGQDVP